MQNATQEMDDLIRQVKTGSAFESLAAAEKIAELSRARRSVDGVRFGDTWLASVPGTEPDFRHLTALLSRLTMEWSEDAAALQRFRDALMITIAHIDKLTTLAPKAQRNAG